MPYAEKIVGVYSILNTDTGMRYVGQSRNVKKRLADHLCLLRAKRHPNKRLQYSFNKHGESSFLFSSEVVCDDPVDLNSVEQCFLSGDAYFGDNLGLYNLSKDPCAPMKSRSHSLETREKISKSKSGKREHVTDIYRQRLRRAAIERAMSDRSMRRIVKLVIENQDMRNCDLAKLIGKDPSTCNKIKKRFRKLNEQGDLNGFYPL